MRFLKNTLGLLLFISFLNVTATPLQNTSTISTITDEDKVAQFPGGKAKMNTWIKENLRFPTENVRYGIVRVEFTVKKNGKCSNFTIKKGIDEDMNFSAVECLEGMPLWESAVKDGKKVNSIVVVPVQFSSDKN